MAPELPIGRASPPTDRTKPYSRGTPTACHVYLRGLPSPSTQPADTKVWPSRCFALNSWHRKAILGPIYHQRAPALSLGVLLPGQATVAGPEGGTAPWCSGPDSETTAGASSICVPMAVAGHSLCLTFSWARSCRERTDGACWTWGNAIGEGKATADSGLAVLVLTSSQLCGKTLVCSGLGPACTLGQSCSI